jgi:hypothetical protein
MRRPAAHATVARDLFKKSGRHAMETQLISLRLPAPLVQRMDEMARRKSRSRAAIVEEALRQFLRGGDIAHSGADMTCARDSGTDEPLYKMTEG